MSRPLDALLDYFPAGATESETHILPRAFVHSESYSELVAPPPTSPRLMVGRKGTGKTAIIDFYRTLLADAGVPTLLVRPMDIDVSDFPDEAALGEVTRVALGALCSAIAARLGKELAGLLDEQTKPLYEEAVSAGTQERDAIEKLAELLPRLAKAFTGFDLPSDLPARNRRSLERLQRAIEENIAQSGRTFHLYLDDTDQVAAPDHPAHLQRIWAFLLASRELAQRVPQLRIVVSLREEVWRRLVRDSAGQRDQADHFLPLVRELFPSRDLIWAVVSRRLELACEDLNRDPENVTSPFFEGQGARMPYSREFRSWRDLIVVRSRERPRDAIQLINLLARGAKEADRRKITGSDFEHRIREFSAQRVRLLAQEVEEECPQIVEIVEALADVEFDEGGFTCSTENLRQVMLRIPSEMGVQLYGRRLRPINEEDALRLWRYLFELGIINARASDKRMPKGYRHIQPKEDPRLISKARWNDMQALLWEINPAYRDHLIKVQGDAEARTGLPRKSR